jgi:hypothetical protein
VPEETDSMPNPCDDRTKIMIKNDETIEYRDNDEYRKKCREKIETGRNIIWSSNGDNIGKNTDDMKYNDKINKMEVKIEYNSIVKRDKMNNDREKKIIDISMVGENNKKEDDIKTDHSNNKDIQDDGILRNTEKDYGKILFKIKQRLQKIIEREISASENEKKYNLSPVHISDHNNISKDTIIQPYRDMNEYYTRIIEKIINELVQKIKVKVRNGITHIYVRIKTEYIGELESDISVKYGKLMAEFLVRDLAVKQLIEYNIEMLRSALEASGIQMGLINIFVKEGYSELDERQKFQMPKKYYTSGDNRKKVDTREEILKLWMVGTLNVIA